MRTSTGVYSLLSRKISVARQEMRTAPRGPQSLAAAHELAKLVWRRSKLQSQAFAKDKGLL